MSSIEPSEESMRGTSTPPSLDTSTTYSTECSTDKESFKSIENDIEKGHTQESDAHRTDIVLPRREFISLSALALAAGTLGIQPAEAMAGPFDEADFVRLIPPDKRLTPEWTKSLFAPGKPTTYSQKRNEIRHIGMPVGGICTGTLYLGGDGRLWLWDIFNENKNGIQPRRVAWSGYDGEGGSVDPQNGANYVSPAEPRSPLDQAFALCIAGDVRPLHAGHWDEITFQGEYPVGIVRYTDPQCPLQVTLNAYSPFIPLNADDSGLPVTLCEFTLHNSSNTTVTAQIGGWMQNVICLSAQQATGKRYNRVTKSAGLTAVISQFEQDAPVTAVTPRSDRLIDDFNRSVWAPWKATGTAFGAGPVLRKEVPAYQGDLGGEGDRVVNSHAKAPGNDIAAKDAQTGTLTSPPFVIERHFITFYIGGGSNIDQVGMRLMVDGKEVHRATGHDNNRMRAAMFSVQNLEGKTAILEIYDHGVGAWGNIGVARIVQTDKPIDSNLNSHPLEKAGDWGEMALALLGSGHASASTTPETLFTTLAQTDGAKEAHLLPFQKLMGGIARSVTLAPGRSETVTFAIAWRFPNSNLNVPDARTGNHYAQRFPSIAKLLEYLTREYPRLSKETKLWHATWYDSTLPHWFLDRTFLNTSILATSTAHRFASGRFWGWEGIGCCPGTCTHVWHYAQAPGRIFPELERHTREHVDFADGVGFDAASGMVRHRAEGSGPAVDGQCGRILGVLREHQMSPDDSFLKRVWPNVKRAMEYMMHHDKDGDGLLDGAQENTLDAAWYGKIAWLSSLYAAALRACETMATELKDTEFANLCGRKAEQTGVAIERELFNGEYYIQKPEPGRERTLGTYQTCHIDQVHGQSWAWQVDLPRILGREHTLSALKALYKYNFALDIGPFKRKNRPGRPYALPGDGGLIMSTNPKELEHAFGNVQDWQFGYFNECMSGFEHQVASHMIAEGLALEGLAVTRAIHDRYHASRRNPYNEIECSDHYSRAMASYGSFITACGYTYHGPKGHMGFAPRLSENNFKAAFTAAEGWGSFTQHQENDTLHAELAVRYGSLQLTRLTLTDRNSKTKPKTQPKIKATVDGKSVVATCSLQTEAGTAATPNRIHITFPTPLRIRTGQTLSLSLVSSRI